MRIIDASISSLKKNYSQIIQRERTCYYKRASDAFSMYVYIRDTRVLIDPPFIEFLCSSKFWIVSPTLFQLQLCFNFKRLNAPVSILTTLKLFVWNNKRVRYTKCFSKKLNWEQKDSYKTLEFYWPDLTHSVYLTRLLFQTNNFNVVKVKAEVLLIWPGTTCSVFLFSLSYF